MRGDVKRFAKSWTVFAPGEPISIGSPRRLMQDPGTVSAGRLLLNLIAWYLIPVALVVSLAESTLLLALRHAVF
jgi:hypothetical protein